MKRSQRTFWGWGLIPIAALTFTEPLSHNVVPLEHTHPTCYSTNIPARNENYLNCFSFGRSFVGGRS